MNLKMTMNLKMLNQVQVVVCWLFLLMSLNTSSTSTSTSQVNAHMGEAEHHSAHDFNVTTDANGCTTVVHRQDPLLHKPVYRVGVYSSEGDQAAFDLYGKLFSEYLTETAGIRFDPPIRFELVPVSLSQLMEQAQEEEVDFLFGSSAVFSCMATEYQAQALVTIINRRESRGHSYDLDLYGGVMFVKKDNHDVNTIQDFIGRTIGAGSITAMGGGQTQFYSLFVNGVSYVADPKQVIFTKDERLVVQGLLDGDFEIGFARTDQIERHTDERGRPLPDDTFKIINPQTHVLDDGTIFPFVSSTGLHPEWPVAALHHTDKTVSKEVQEALLALTDHAMSIDLQENLLCHTTPHIAQLALDAATSGYFTGFRTARSYFGVRTKQESAGFISKDPVSGDLHCIRGDTLYQDIQCPSEHYKLPKDEFDRSCEVAGLECKEGYECFCQPCIKAFEVDVFQYNENDHEHMPLAGGSNNATTAVAAASASASAAAVLKQSGCSKMSVCGEVQQTKEITLRAIDNVERKNARVEAIIHMERYDITLDVYRVGPYTYEMTWGYPEVGVGILEVFVNGVQIPESPLRITVIERDCSIDFGGRNMAADASGNCQCADSTIEIGGECIDVAIFAVSGSIVGLVIIAIATILYIRHKNRKSDEVWQVFPEELHFDDPVEVIGQGSFGVVVLAEYRGTKVAIKRVLSSQKKKEGSRAGTHSGGRSGSRSGGRSGSRSSFRSPSTDGRTSTAANLENMGFNNEGSVVVAAEASNTTGIGGASIGTHSSHGSNEVADLEVGTVTSGPLENSGILLSHETGGIGSNLVANDNSDYVSRRFSLAFLNRELKGKKSKWAKLFPWCFGDGNGYQSRTLHESVLGSASAARSSRVGQMFCPCINNTARLHAEFKTEMRVLARLRHPCITTVMGAVLTRHHDPVMVMEYMEYGSLHDLLRNDTMLLTGEIILQITRDLAQGLRFLHANKPQPILHGDLKARNILIDNRFRAKLCDFGLCTKRSSEISGTPFWLAPEYLLGEKYNASCDIYSVGIILYEIFSRKNPYEGENFKQVIRGVCNRRVNKRPKIPPQTPPKFVDLMKKCWSHEIHYRPPARVLDTSLMEMSPEDAEPLEEVAGETIWKRADAAMTLYDIFPKHVAEALQKGQKVEPEKHELVTVIFSDIIDYTKISRYLPPEKVCDMLDRLYVAFDHCARNHQVFKVETIGDAWMGVTNLENNQEDCHVKNIAEMAVDMVNTASQIIIDPDDPDMGCVRIRVGFHSGSVVSNVIGSLNKRYCLFGDTVNTASRMESNSAVNRILCSERSYVLLKKQAKKMHTKRRGTITVKGKGEMAVYWVGDNLLKPRKGIKEKTVEFDFDSHAKSEGARDASFRSSFNIGSSFKSVEAENKPSMENSGYIGDIDRNTVPSSEETPTMDSDDELEETGDLDGIKVKMEDPNEVKGYDDSLNGFEDALVNSEFVVA